MKCVSVCQTNSSVLNIVTDLFRALLSNGSVKNLNRKTVFYGVRAATVAMQWFGKRVSTMEAVLCGVHAKDLSKKNKRRYDSVPNEES
jgi:predicted branched-subunit amino acid permease